MITIAKQLPNYNHETTEKKWQKFWKDNECAKFDETSTKPKYYVLSMFAYPSGKIHVGHSRNYSLGDVMARCKKMQGYEVLHPMGWDAFGLPAENAAIKNQKHPSEWTYSNISAMKQTFEMLGLAYDWSREFATCDVSYYKHQQKIFLDLYKKGLAFQKESFVNWDPVDQTVLANEQVENGRGWRSGALVEKRKLKQWFFKVTQYTEELLQGLKKLDGWPERVRSMQENWIGKSEGLMMDFKLVGRNDKIRVFSTRPDTIFGASFIAISANHPLAAELGKKDSKIQDFIDECNTTSVDEETIATAEKKGMDVGLKVQHPFDENWQLPVYIANFVLMDYGTGAIFACPAHDERDFEFATKYNLPIKQVVAKKEDINNLPNKLNQAYTEDGILVNSDFLNGMTVAKAKEEVAKRLEKKGEGERQINYRLRDWGVSRQRYWGCPIPMIHCNKCGVVPVPEKDLPIELPIDVVFDGRGNPLANHPTWKKTKCPKCGGDAERETDTLDTFVDSSWYFARYCGLEENRPVNTEVCNRVLPIDQYIGGIEHATMHLIYCRFMTKAMRDCGYFNIDEPATKLFSQGMICHQAYKDESGNWTYPADVVKNPDGTYKHKKTGEKITVFPMEKMSKSKNNVVEPGEIIDVYGADAERLFVLSDTPADKDVEWTDAGIEGSWRYVNKLWKLILSFTEQYPKAGTLPVPAAENLNRKQLELLKTVHKTIADVSEYYEEMGFNRAIAKLRELSNMLERHDIKGDTDTALVHFGLKVLIQMFYPITPHIMEELHQMLGGKTNLDQTAWPKASPEFLVDDTVTIAVQVNGKLKGTIEVAKDAPEEEVKKLALAEEGVVRYIRGKEVKKVIVVKNRIVSVVV